MFTGHRIQVVKKNCLKPWQKKMWCIPPRRSGEFVAAMEDVLSVYKRRYNPRRPVVCFDETSKQLVAETRESIATEPGKPARMDYEYRRCGTANIFMMFEPLACWRHVKVTDRRTRIDFAHCMRELVDEWYPEATKIVLVMDNLNTHTIGSLYETFKPSEALRIARKLEMHYTPKHGSWLNMAEIEIGALSCQCTGRRIASMERLSNEIAAWERARNENSRTANWQFTTSKARVKLKNLYPEIV
jgi:hypothetical protein